MRNKHLIISERLDKWLFYTRFFKTRALAAQHCETEGVRVNGQPTKRADYKIKRDDVLTFFLHSHIRIIKVLEFPQARIPAKLKTDFLIDLDPPKGEKRIQTSQTN